MNKIELTITDRIKEKLNIHKDISIFELYALLYKTRNNSHPDLFDERLKDEATEKFSSLNSLLEEFKLYIDNQKLNKVGNELIVHKYDYENVINKNQIISLESKVLLLQEKLDDKLQKIESLELQIKSLKEDELSKSEGELRELYRPKKNSIWILGISGTLVLLINILVHITTLKNNFIDLFPFKIEVLSTFLSFVFIFIVIKILLNNYHLNKMKKTSEELKTNDLIQTFLMVYVHSRNRGYSEDYIKDKFSESQVERFIKGSFFKSKSSFKKKAINELIDNIFYPNKEKT